MKYELNAYVFVSDGFFKGGHYETVVIIAERQSEYLIERSNGELESWGKSLVYRPI